MKGTKLHQIIRQRRQCNLTTRSFIIFSREREWERERADQLMKGKRKPAVRIHHVFFWYRFVKRLHFVLMPRFFVWWFFPPVSNPSSQIMSKVVLWGNKPKAVNLRAFLLNKWYHCLRGGAHTETRRSLMQRIRLTKECMPRGKQKTPFCWLSLFSRTLLINLTRQKRDHSTQRWIAALSVLTLLTCSTSHRTFKARKFQSHTSGFEIKLSISGQFINGAEVKVVKFVQMAKTVYPAETDW